MTIRRRPLSFAPTRSSSISADATETIEQDDYLCRTGRRPTFQRNKPLELDRNKISSNDTTASELPDRDFMSLRSEVYCMQLQNAEMLEVIRQQLDFLDGDSKPPLKQEDTTIEIRKHNPDHVLRRLATRLVLKVMQRTTTLVLRRCLLCWRCAVAPLHIHCSVPETHTVIEKYRRLQLRTSWAHWKRRASSTAIVADVLSRAFGRASQAASAGFFARWREHIQTCKAKKAMAVNIIRRSLSLFERRRTQLRLIAWKLTTILFKQRSDQSRVHAVRLVMQIARQNSQSVQRRAVTTWLVTSIMEGITQRESRRYRGMSFLFVKLSFKRLVKLMRFWNRWKYKYISKLQSQQERTLSATQGAKVLGRILYTSFVHLCASAWYRWMGRVERAREASGVIAKMYKRSRHTRLLVAFHAWKSLPTSIRMMRLEKAIYKLSCTQEHMFLRFKARQFRRWNSLATRSMKPLARTLRITFRKWSMLRVSICFRKWHDKTGRRSSFSARHEHIVPPRVQNRENAFQACCFKNSNATTTRVTMEGRSFNNVSTWPPTDLEMEGSIQSVDLYNSSAQSKLLCAQCLLLHTRRLIDRQMLLSTHHHFHLWRTLCKKRLRTCELPLLRRMYDVTRLWIVGCIYRSFHRWLSAATQIRKCTEICILTINGVLSRWELKVKISAFQHWSKSGEPDSEIFPLAYHLASAMKRWAWIRRYFCFEKWISLVTSNEMLTRHTPYNAQQLMPRRSVVATQEWSPAQNVLHYSRRELIHMRSSRWRDNLRATFDDRDVTQPIRENLQATKSAPRGKLVTLLFRRLRQIRLMHGFYVWRGAIQEIHIDSLLEVHEVGRHIYNMAVKAHEESLARERNTLAQAAFSLRATSLLHSVCTRRASSQHDVCLAFLVWRVASLSRLVALKGPMAFNKQTLDDTVNANQYLSP